ncbi:MAG TPA: DNA repair protein RadC [Saprospiraceae bacterium]|nr:DNA repair protein RadC [Saprospiraceae bacterium]
MIENSYHFNNLNIKSWAEEDRPREKLMLKGRASLSNAELVAILLGSGSRTETAVSLAQIILKEFDNNLDLLGRASLSELTQFKGIGNAKAISIVAALELGKRRQSIAKEVLPQIRCSQNAYEIIASDLLYLSHEEFWIILLNRSNRVIAKIRVSSGGVSGTVVDAKLVFKKAIERLACGIILCHNHPSGALYPSQQDIDMTRKLKKAGEHLDCSVLDHIIVGQDGYYSFGDEGMI